MNALHLSDLMHCLCRAKAPTTSKADVKSAYLQGLRFIMRLNLRGCSFTSEIIETSADCESRIRRLNKDIVRARSDDSIRDYCVSSQNINSKTTKHTALSLGWRNIQRRIWLNSRAQETINNERNPILSREIANRLESDVNSEIFELLGRRRGESMNLKSFLRADGESFFFLGWLKIMEISESFN
jgi:hypothetical protein